MIAAREDWRTTNSEAQSMWSCGFTQTTNNVFESDDIGSNFNPRHGVHLHELKSSRFSQQPSHGITERVAEAIAESKSMLNLGDDWDGEGAIGIAGQTWLRATDFLKRNATILWEKYGTEIESPTISPLVDGSIDLHWSVAKKELLVNIPAHLNLRAKYYGDDKAGGHVVEGDLDTDAYNHWLLVWLSE